jgi:CheY-like chemotaxis protein
VFSATTSSRRLSADEALELIRVEQPFHVVLCDLMMPELTGIDVYQALKGMGLGLEKRIVFLTGGAFTEQARGFLATVPNLRIDKPFSPEGLERTIRRAAEEALEPVVSTLSA